VIFSGGMSYDRAGRTPCITVMSGKNTTVLEMEHTIIDFVVLCETPWQNGKICSSIYNNIMLRKSVLFHCWTALNNVNNGV
jgi:hypothetical protein